MSARESMEDPVAIQEYQPIGQKSRNRYGLWCFYFALAVIVVLLAIITAYVVTIEEKDLWGEGQLSSPDSVSEADIQECIDENSVSPRLTPTKRSKEGQSVVIRNAWLWTGRPGDDDEHFSENLVDIEVEDGVITAIVESSENANMNQDLDEIDVDGRIVTPGMVDLHSHLGVSGWPSVWANGDTNEGSDPITNYVRAIDGFNPDDIAIPHVREGGVTSANILPGSANMMGGEGFYVKTRDSHNINDLVIDAEFRSMKMACGENPKRSYGQNRDVMPRSRMGSAWLMREQFDKARRMYNQQRSWCTDQILSGSGGGEMPYDLSLDSLVALFRGQVKLNVHCYQSHDVTMMIRLTKEFDFNISSFHHAIETYQVADLLAEEGIAAAIFTDNWGFKFEGYDASVWSAKILNDEGTDVVIKSDHPVINSNGLMFEAAKAAHYDFPDYKAIASVTSVPAERMGLEDQIGIIDEGFDADLVVWERDPLTTGAIPTHVFVDGELLFELDGFSNPNPEHPTHWELLEASQQVEMSGACDEFIDENGDPVEGHFTSEAYIVNGITVYHQNAGDPEPIEDGSILVVNGIVSCIDTVEICKAKADELGIEDPDEIDLTEGAIATPGFIEGGGNIGLVEIPGETGAENGSPADSGATAPSVNAPIRAVDGVRYLSAPGDRQVEAAFRGGVTLVVSRVQGNRFVGGLSASFYTCCSNLVRDQLIEEEAALHITVGTGAKQGGLTNSISGQMLALRNLFQDAVDSADPENSFGRAIAGEIPVVARVNDVGTIASLLEVKKEFEFGLVILGGTEAHLIADKLAEEEVAVLYVEEVAPDSFDSLNYDRSSVSILKSAGVLTGIITDDTSMARNLRWEAGKAIMRGNLTEEDALESITCCIPAIYGISGDEFHPGRIYEDEPANFVVFDGPWHSLQSHIKLVALQEDIRCNPRQK